MTKLLDNNLANKPEGVLLAFYQGQHPDSKGRMIEEIWSWDYEMLEEIHDYIQWLFPLIEQSRFNQNVPILDDEVIQAFRNNEQLRNRLVKSLKIMLDFYGLQCHEPSTANIEVIKSDKYWERKPKWVNLLNHNYLRLTRILTSLKILGLENYALALFRCLDQIYQEESQRIGRETYAYWKKVLT